MPFLIARPAVFLVLLLSWSAVCVPTPASAWTAVAHNPERGVSYLYYMAKSAAEAEREALAGCERATNGCRLLGETRDGPLATVVIHSPAGVYRGSHADPDQALRQAMQDCQESHGACRLGSAAWARGTDIMAIAIDHENVWIGRSLPTESEARENAMSLCRDSSRSPDRCTLFHLLTGPGWVAVARGPDRSGIGMSVRSPEIAKNNALLECERGDQEMAAEVAICSDVVIHQNSPGTPEPGRYRELVQTIRTDKRAQTASVPPFLGIPVR